MTSPCNFDDLDCPQPENYAAIAKQLHETAMQAEERIYCLEQQLRSAVNRPTVVVTTTADMGPFSADIGTDPLTGSQIFSPSHAVVNTFRNTLDATTSFNGWSLSPGMWHVGAYGATFSVGAASDNTYRQIRAILMRPNPAGLFTYAQEDSETSFESANGVQILITTSAVFRVEAGDRVIFIFRHGNIASNVSIATGAIAWFTRLSDSNVIRVI